MLMVLETTRWLRLTRPGRLLSWLGPALRGLIARCFKARVCRHPAEAQETTWRYCKGCPFLAECPYGQTFEPDPPPAAAVFTGQTDPARPVVLAPPFPAPARAAPGLTLPLRVTFIGTAAARHVADFWDAVREAGADPAGGLDPDHTTFEVLAEGAAEVRRLVDLPLRPDAVAGIVPRLTVELIGPLFLRTAAPGEPRRRVAAPSFADLFRAGLRTVGRLYALYDQPLPADFAALKAAAAEVPTLTADYRPFRQPKLSNRSGQRGLLRGVLGSGTYGSVPLALTRWLLWAGRLHAGTHRVAGAGGWRLAWSDVHGSGTWQEMS